MGGPTLAAHRAGPHFKAWRVVADRTVASQVNTPGTVLHSHRKDPLA